MNDLISKIDSDNDQEVDFDNHFNNWIENNSQEFYWFDMAEEARKILGHMYDSEIEENSRVAWLLESLCISSSRCFLYLLADAFGVDRRSFEHAMETVIEQKEKVKISDVQQLVDDAGTFIRRLDAGEFDKK